MNSARNANLHSKSSLPALSDLTDARPDFDRSLRVCFQGLGTLSCGQFFSVPRLHLDTSARARSAQVYPTQLP